MKYPEQQHESLVLGRQVGQIIDIGFDISVIVTQIKGSKVRLGVHAPSHMPIDRREVRIDKIDCGFLTPPQDTPRYMQVLVAMRQHMDQHGCAPTLKQLADAMGISTPVVFEHIQALIGRGLVTREKPPNVMAGYVPVSHCPSCGREFQTKESSC